MAEPRQVRYAVQRVLEAAGIRLSNEDHLLLQERGFFKGSAPRQADVATMLGCSQPQVSILENNLVARLNRAAARIAEAQNAPESHLDTLAAVYDTVDAAALRAGFAMDDVKQRSRRRLDGDGETDA